LPCATGGNFSYIYEVEKEGTWAILKAFDFAGAFQSRDIAQALQDMTAAYIHERDILDHCGKKRLSNVVKAIDKGDIAVPGLNPMEGKVLYLIFEKATGDVRCQLSSHTRRDSLWCMKALKDACLGLMQLHRETIAHQDTKPSNVLIFDRGPSKIADFGRASRLGHPTLHDGFAIP
jgi:serine/threonine protein kinase